MPDPQYGSMQRQTAWAIAIMSCVVCASSKYKTQIATYCVGIRHLNIWNWKSIQVLKINIGTLSTIESNKHNKFIYLGNLISLNGFSGDYRPEAATAVTLLNLQFCNWTFTLNKPSFVTSKKPESPDTQQPLELLIYSLYAFNAIMLVTWALISE